jgi:hypothetical protein
MFGTFSDELLSSSETNAIGTICNESDFSIEFAQFSFNAKC